MQKRDSLFFYFFFFLALSLIIFSFQDLSLINTIEGSLGRIFSPLRLAQISFAQKPSEIAKEEEKINLGSIQTTLRSLQAEMNALRDQFEVSYPRSQSLLAAKIVGEPAFFPGKTKPAFLIIDKGSQDGVKKGQAVVLGSNLIGKIVDLNSNFSKVMLITNKSTSFTGKTENSSSGVVKGAGEDIMEFNNILQSVDLKKDSKVYTKGDQNLEGTGFPPDLIVGKIVSTAKNPSDLFQKVLIKPLIDFAKITRVFVILQ